MRDTITTLGAAMITFTDLKKSMPPTEQRQPPPQKIVTVGESLGDKSMPPRDNEKACDRCGNMRFIATKDGGMIPCPKCGVAQKWKSAAIEAYSSLNGRAAGQTFEAYQAKETWQKNLRETCRAFAENPRGWLVLCGSKGTGKSHMCAAIANARKANNEACLFISAMDLLTSLRACFDGREPQTYAERLQVYQRAALLIIDDIGAERSTEWTASVWGELIEPRYRNRLPTVLVSNYDLSRGVGFLDSRVTDRINERNLSKIVLLEGLPSYRTQETAHV
jgi:DNA replication protein DnaC